MAVCVRFWILGLWHLLFEPATILPIADRQLPLLIRVAMLGIAWMRTVYFIYLAGEVLAMSADATAIAISPLVAAGRRWWAVGIRVAAWEAAQVAACLWWMLGEEPVVKELVIGAAALAAGPLGVRIGVQNLRGLGNIWSNPEAPSLAVFALSSAVFTVIGVAAVPHYVANVMRHRGMH